MKVDTRRKVIISAIVLGTIIVAGIIATSVLISRNKDEAAYPWVELDINNIPDSLALDVSCSLIEAGCTDISGLESRPWLTTLTSNNETIVLVKSNIIVTKSASSNDSAVFHAYDIGQGSLLENKGKTIESQDFLPIDELSVDVSRDGSTIVIGNPAYYDTSVPYSGFVQAFRFINETWTPLGERIRGVCDGSSGCSTCSNQMYHELGSQVKINGDGSRLVLGTWVQVGNDIVRPDPDGTLGTSIQGFGASLSISTDGQKVAIGAFDGMCGVFHLENGQWVEVGEMWNLYSESDSFYHHQYVTLSDDGRRVAIGAETYGEELHDWDNTQTEGMVKVFAWNTDGSWQQLGDDLVGPRGFGHTVGMSPDGSIVAVFTAQGATSYCQVFTCPTDWK